MFAMGGGDGVVRCFNIQPAGFNWESKWWFEEAVTSKMNEWLIDWLISNNKLLIFEKF